MARPAHLALALLVPLAACTRTAPLPLDMPDASAHGDAASDAATHDASAHDAESGDAEGRDAASPHDAGASFTAGNACQTPHTCGPSYDCYTLAPGGYCMPGAPGGPTACRPPDVTCPEGTACSPLPYHQISGVCLLACRTSDDCRPGYLCTFVQLFPGDPSSPHSDARVCWTACEPGVDQLCNDDPVISSIHGTCQPDGTCLCRDGYAKNPETGRCL